MTITIYAAEPKRIVLYQLKDFAAWKRVDAEGVLLQPGNYKVAIMSHIYGIPKPETIVSLVSKPEHEGAQIGLNEYAENTDEQPLLESHYIRAEFG